MSHHKHMEFCRLAIRHTSPDRHTTAMDVAQLQPLNRFLQHGILRLQRQTALHMLNSYNSPMPTNQARMQQQQAPQHQSSPPVGVGNNAESGKMGNDMEINRKTNSLRKSPEIHRTLSIGAATLLITWPRYTYVGGTRWSGSPTQPGNFQ